MRASRKSTPLGIAILLLKRSVLLCAFLLIACAGPQKAPASKQRGLYWSVRSANSQVYLLGSIHVAKPELYPLPPAIEMGFADADVLVVEADTGSSKPESNADMDFIVQAGSYPANENLRKGLSPSTYAKAKEKLATVGLDIGQFDRFKPWVVVFTLTGLELQRLGFKTEYGIDHHFIEKARGKKKIIELEGIREQIGTLNAFSAQEQDQFLLFTLADLERFETQIDAMFAAWSRGDATDFNRMMAESFSDRPELEAISEKLLNRRNETMLAKIESFLTESGSYFVVVGTGHLVGKDGIVKRLEKKGYTVNQR